MTYYEIFQQEKYKNVLPGCDPDEIENDSARTEQSEIKTDQQAEIELIELQY